MADGRGDLRELLSVIHVAEWPQRKCRLLVSEMPLDGVPRDDLCVIFEDHLGPCAATGIPSSIRRRAAWEKDNPGKAAKAAGFSSDPYG